MTRARRAYKILSISSLFISSLALVGSVYAYVLGLGDAYLLFTVIWGVITVWSLREAVNAFKS